MSLRNETPRSSAQRCTSGSKLSTESGMPSAASALITGSRRRISSAAPTGLAAMLLAAAPSSTIEAPSSTKRRACAIAAAGSRNRPPSENESPVMLTMPTRMGPAGGLARAGAFEDCPDTASLRKHVELLDRGADMRDAQIEKADIANLLCEPFAQIDMAGFGNRPDR